MKKKFWTILALFVVIPGLLFMVSCAAPKVDPGTAPDKDAKTEESAEAYVPRDAEGNPLEGQELQQALADEKDSFLNKDIQFEFDSSTILPAAEVVLRDKATWLKRNPGQVVLVEGHCDERGTNEYNLALGDRRAQSAKNFLMYLGIDASRLSTVSYGEEKPLDPGSSPNAWSKNRRAHFVIE